MALMEKFFFFCSVRLGSIITGTLTLLQALVLLTVSISGTNSLETVKEILLKSCKAISLEGALVQALINNPHSVIITLCVFFSGLLGSSIVLIYGSLKFKTVLISQFLLFYLSYICMVLAVLIWAVLYVKVHGSGLGELILYANLAGFAMLFYLYTWASVLSLVQILRELKRRLRMRQLRKMPPKEIKVIYSNARQR